MHLILTADSGFNVPNCVASVGIFDGIHSGHSFLIDELKSLAQQRGLKTVLISFAIQPRKVLNPMHKVDLLTTNEEKIVLIRSKDIDYFVLMDFTPEIAKLSAQQFIENILFKKFNVRTLLVGHDHRFGYNRLDGFDEYNRYGEQVGMEVIKAARFHTVDDPEISSSEIRMALLSGDVERANRMLGYTYSLSGEVVEGYKVGRTIGFPTANIQPDHEDKIVPANGVYHINILVDGLCYTGMLNIGTRPTLENGVHTSIEAHILNFNDTIYHKTVKIEFLHKIRDEIKFSGLAELKKQIEVDKQFVLNAYK